MLAWRGWPVVSQVIGVASKVLSHANAVEKGKQT